MILQNSKKNSHLHVMMNNPMQFQCTGVQLFAFFFCWDNLMHCSRSPLAMWRAFLFSFVSVVVVRH